MYYYKISLLYISSNNSNNIIHTKKTNTTNQNLLQRETSQFELLVNFHFFP